MSAWLIVLVAGAGSLALRASVALLVDRVTTPAWLEPTAALVVPAAFTGIAATTLAGPLGEVDRDAVLLGLAVTTTVVLAARGRSVPLAFAAGLGVLWSTTAVIAAL
jgi:branched-subunit amino acid transport protein